MLVLSAVVVLGIGPPLNLEWIMLQAQGFGLLRIPRNAVQAPIRHSHGTLDQFSPSLAASKHGLFSSRTAISNLVPSFLSPSSCCTASLPCPGLLLERLNPFRKSTPCTRGHVAFPLVREFLSPFRNGARIFLVKFITFVLLE